MQKNKISWLLFIFKTILLFCFIYEFRLNALQNPIFSSRKIVFVIAVMYFFYKRYSLLKLINSVDYKAVIKICLLCIAYVSFLNFNRLGSGSNIISWYIYFLLYACIGPIIFAGLFNFNFEKYIQSICAVTLFQAVWCILTFYIFNIRELNDTVFFVEENENISYLATNRLRSVGAAGATLSVILSLSSFSFLYFILKGKDVLLNSLFYIVCAYATFLAGTTGLLIVFVSVTSILAVSFSKRKQGFIFIIMALFSIIFFLSETSQFLDNNSYDKLTYKTIDFLLNGEESSTFQNLGYQKVPPISFETIVGTGFSRGRTFSGLICTHDGGYYRSYFGIGLIMATLFYCVLFITMYKMLNKIAINKSVKLIFLVYIIICAIIEYKEPFMLKYIPFFLFIIYCMKIQEDNGNNIGKLAYKLNNK